MQMLLELEAAYGIADTPGSLMDHALVGMITAIRKRACHPLVKPRMSDIYWIDENPDAEVPESDYLMTLLRDPTASHLLETLVRRSPDRVFDIMWRTYFTGKLAKLAVHPVANFVVAKAFERLNTEQLDAAVDEVKDVATKIVSEYLLRATEKSELWLTSLAENSRTGVLRALVDRSSAIQSGVEQVVQVMSACPFVS